MFELVSDIQRYPEFVKWLTALRVQDRRTENGVHQCVGEAVIAFKGFTHKFATNVTASPKEGYVKVDLLRGPFRHLINNWHFTQEGIDSTRINFHIEYEFSNFLLQTLARANHAYAIEKIMETFLSEAKRRYGGPLRL